MTDVKKTAQLPDGIHIDLPFDDYLADDALQSSDIKNLLISPLQYWINSPLNPNRPPNKGTAAKDLGTLIHEVILENPDKPLAQKPSGMSFTTKDGKAWRKQQLDNGVTIVTEDENRTLSTIIDACRRSGVTDELRGSIPEVTYVWTHESGHRCKIRLDAIKSTMAFDLKTFVNQQSKDLDVCLAYATGNLRYHISAVWYRLGIDHMRSVKLPVVHWHDEKRDKSKVVEVIEGVINHDGHFPHWYIYLEKDGIPNVIPRQFVKRNSDSMPINEYWKMACMGVDRATTIFAEFSKEFAPGEMWMKPTEWKSWTDEELAPARSIFS